jgi:hypothetical protein
MKHTNTVWAKYRVNVTAGGTYSYHYISAQHASHSSLQNFNVPKSVRFVLQVDTSFHFTCTIHNILNAKPSHGAGNFGKMWSTRGKHEIQYTE